MKYEKYYFIHIRKTAGTSIRAFMQKNFPEKERCPELSQHALYSKHAAPDRASYLEQFNLVSGHYYTVPRFFQTKRFTFTFLREPITRVISEINQIYADKRDFLHKYAITKEVTDILYEENFARALNNSQTRFLVANAGHNYEGLSDEERVGIAKEYIETIDFCGITESFECSLKALSLLTGMNLPNRIPRENTEITRKGIKKNTAAHLLGDLYALNQLDIAVYEHAQRRFDGTCSQYIGGNGLHQ